MAVNVVATPHYTTERKNIVVLFIFVCRFFLSNNHCHPLSLARLADLSNICTAVIG